MENIIYIVEDDEFIRDGLIHLLLAENYIVKDFATISECEAELEKEVPDLMVLDVLLSDGIGFDFCENIRQKYFFPVLFLTCCDEEYNMVRGFESGADDYVTKPFRVKELLLRIRALLRRSSQKNMPVQNQKDFVIDEDHHQVFFKKENIGLTPTEYYLFLYLYKRCGKLVSRQELLYDVWDLKGNYIDENTLNVHISSIRKKLKENGKKLETVRGFGYRFDL